MYLFRFQRMMNAADGALFSLEHGYGVYGKVRLGVLVILGSDGGRQVVHGAANATQLAQVVDGVNLLGAGDDPEQPRRLRVAPTRASNP